MCGIVGYVGAQDAAPILLEGLGRLEYRGYDCAGVAVVRPRAGLKIRKVSGPGRRPRRRRSPRGSRARPGIGHTRWATHGEPTEENAHPHTDAAGRIAVVHNGIIENADELRAKLTADGVEFALADRHRDRRAPRRGRVRRRGRRPRAGRAPGAAPGRRGVRHRGAGRRAPGPDRRRPQRQPGAAGRRREGDVRRLRRRRADRLHPPGRLPRRRRAGDDHRDRLPHVHPRRPSRRPRARPRSTGTWSAPRSATTRTSC